MFRTFSLDGDPLLPFLRDSTSQPKRKEANSHKCELNTKHTDSVSSGKIYSNVLKNEREGKYLGATIQVIPHVTDEIKNFIFSGKATQNIKKMELINKEKEGEIYKNIKNIFSDAELLEVKKKD